MKKRQASGLQSVPIGQIRTELTRRRTRLPKLLTRREQLAKELEALDQQINDLRGSPGQKRPTNDATLVQYLAKVLQGKTMGVTEVAEAVQKAGYNTNADNFRTIVNQALLKNTGKFKKVSRGKYTAI